MLRALVMHLDALTEREVAMLNIATGIPLRYDLDDCLQPALGGARSGHEHSRECA